MEELNHKNSFEVLLMEEFADRLKVGRSTICNWKNDGTLVAGRHYIQKGKVLRFIWAIDLILELHDKKDSATGSNEKILPENNSPSRIRSKKVGLNLNY